MTARLYMDNDYLMVSGDLNFDSVVLLWKESLSFLAQQNHWQIDLSQVTSSNSAGLTLLLEWLKYAKHEKKSIELKNIPSQLLAIAKVAGIDEMMSPRPL